MSGRRLSEHDTVSVRSRWRSLALLGSSVDADRRGRRKECNRHVDLHGVVRGKGKREASVVAVEEKMSQASAVAKAVLCTVQESERVLCAHGGRNSVASGTRERSRRGREKMGECCSVRMYCPAED